MVHVLGNLLFLSGDDSVILKSINHLLSHDLSQLIHKRCMQVIMGLLTAVNACQ